MKKVTTLFLGTVTKADKIASALAFDDEGFIKAAAEKVRLDDDG